MIKKPVLLADDEDETARGHVVLQLEKRYGTDYEVMDEASAKRALGTLRSVADEEGRVAIVLADQRTPGMTGWEFLARARGLNPTSNRVLFQTIDYRWLCCSIIGSSFSLPMRS